MKVHEYDQMMRYLTRPADKFSKTDKKAIVADHKKRNEEFWKKHVLDEATVKTNRKKPVHEQLTDLKNFGRNKLVNQQPLPTIKNTPIGNVKIIPKKLSEESAKKRPMNILKYLDLVNKNYADSDIKIKSDAEYERLNPTERYKDHIQELDKQKLKKKVVKIEKPEPKPTEAKQYQFEIPSFYLEDQEERKKQDELLKHSFNKIILSSALNKINDTLSGINGVAVRRKLNEGGPTDDNNNKPILLSDYLKLGLTLANLNDTEREIVKDLLDKSFPKYK